MRGSRGDDARIDSMRYDKGHKDATRAHIIDVASAQFREGGVAAVGIAGIMAGAGLTNGAFYNHFESKEDLVEAVLVNALGERRSGLRAHLEAGKSLDATAPGPGRRNPPSSEDNARCLHRQDHGPRRSDRSPRRQGLGARAPQAGDRRLWADGRGAAGCARPQWPPAFG